MTDRRAAIVWGSLAIALGAAAVMTMNASSVAFAAVAAVYAIERASPRARRFLNRPLRLKGRK